MRLSIPWAATLMLSSLPFVSSRQVNQTIDDTKGDFWEGGQPPQYGEQQGWIVRGDQAPCPGCGVQPDPTKPFEKTWHEATTNIGGTSANVTFSFTGIALYVYCILANTIPFITTESHLQFVLDGQQTGVFNRVSENSSETYLYNQVVFSKLNLPNTRHTFTILNIASPDFGPAGSILMFDYALYTHSTDPSTTPNQAPTPTIPSVSTGFPITSSTSVGISQSGTQSTSNSPNSSQSSASSETQPIEVSDGVTVTVTRSTPNSQPSDPSASANPSSLVQPKARNKLPLAMGLGAAGAVVVIIIVLLIFLLRRRKLRVQQLPVETLDVNDDDRQLDVRRQEKLGLMGKFLSPPTEVSVPPTTVTSSGFSRDTPSDRLHDEIAFLREEVYRLRDQGDVASIAPPPTYASHSVS